MSQSFGGVPAVFPKWHSFMIPLLWVLCHRGLVRGPALQSGESIPVRVLRSLANRVTKHKSTSLEDFGQGGLTDWRGAQGGATVSQRQGVPETQRESCCQEEGGLWTRVLRAACRALPGNGVTLTKGQGAPRMHRHFCLCLRVHLNFYGLKSIACPP